MKHKLDKNKILTYIPSNLELALDDWRQSAKKRLVYLLANNPGEVTHVIMPVIGTNNLSVIAKSANEKLKPLGYEIVCPPAKGRHSWCWYLCEI